MKRLDVLDKEIEELKKRPKDDDHELFSVMEAAVKDDPDVKAMKNKLNSMKLDLLQRYCLEDPDYFAEYESYKALVSKRYVASKQNL